MAKRRALNAPVGLTSNGIVLMNVLGLLGPEEARQMRASMPRGLGSDWFLGVPLDRAHTASLLARVDDAAAEAIAKMRIRLGGTGQGSEESPEQGERGLERRAANTKLRKRMKRRVR